MKPGWTMIQLVRSLVSSGIDSRLVDKTAGLYITTSLQPGIKS